MLERLQTRHLLGVKQKPPSRTLKAGLLRIDKDFSGCMERPANSLVTVAFPLQIRDSRRGTQDGCLPRKFSLPLGELGVQTLKPEPGTSVRPAGEILGGINSVF